MHDIGQWSHCDVAAFLTAALPVVATHEHTYTPTHTSMYTINANTDLSGWAPENFGSPLVTAGCTRCGVPTGEHGHAPHWHGAGMCASGQGHSVGMQCTTSPFGVF